MKQLELANVNLQRKLWSREKIITSLNKKIKTLEDKTTDNPLMLNLCKHNYSPEEIKNALQIRFAVGWKGYKYLVARSKNSLPSYSTVCRYLQKLPFPPGILCDLLPYLQLKIKNDGDENCLIVLDEMELTTAIELDKSTGSFYGYNTLHNKNELGMLQVAIYKKQCKKHLYLAHTLP